MRRFAIVGLCIGLMASAVAGQEYGWTVSASSQDPLLNTAPALNDVATYYLWYVCALGGSETWCAAEFGLSYDGPVPFGAGVTPINGFLNAGTATNLLIAGGHTYGRIIVALLSVISLPGTISFTASDAGLIYGVDCQQGNLLWPIEWVGLGLDAPAPFGGTLCEDNPIATRLSSWGRIKGLYR
jgi:hypothetical protein